MSKCIMLNFENSMFSVNTIILARAEFFQNCINVGFSSDGEFPSRAVGVSSTPDLTEDGD